MEKNPTHEEKTDGSSTPQPNPTGYGTVTATPFGEKSYSGWLHPNWPEARWNISGLFIHRKFLSHLFNVMARVKIADAIRSFHDAPDVVWNGGRTNTGVPFYDDTEKFFKQLNDFGVGVYLTFTNPLLEENHLADSESNRLLDCLDESCGLNGVIVASDVLSDYIRKKKPGLRQTSSVVKSYLENPAGKIQWYRDMQKRFDRVVVHTDHMFDLDLLDKLDRSKAEILVTEECIYKCPNRQRHQLMIARYNLDKSKAVSQEMQKLKKDICMGGAFAIRNERNIAAPRVVYLTHAEMKTIYDMGFREFKISGRRIPVSQLAWNVIHFLYHPGATHYFATALYKKINLDIVDDFKRVAEHKGVVKFPS